MNMEDKVDKVLEEIQEIKIDLKEHMHRTDQNETLIIMNQKAIEPIQKAYIGIKWSIGGIIGVGMLITALLKIKGVL